MTDTGLVFGLAGAAALALLIGGFTQLRVAGANRPRAWLMMTAALVIVFNIWVNSLPLPPPPTAAGTAP